MTIDRGTTKDDYEADGAGMSTRAAMAATTEAEVSKLSLEQALTDFEIANGRVLDLTYRLIELGETNAVLQRDLERLRVEYADLRSVHDRMQTSAAYRIAARVWMIRNALRR